VLYHFQAAGHDLLQTERNIDAIDVAGVQQPLNVLTQAENSGTRRQGIAADAFEH
jgi:hypothetical protein